MKGIKGTTPRCSVNGCLNESHALNLCHKHYKRMRWHGDPTAGRVLVKHGHAAPRTKTYEAWRSMKKRCSNPNVRDYHRYGGRGIAVCEEWQRYDSFLRDMGEATAGMTLERKDNDEGYSKANCCWATPAQQQRNTSRTKH